MPYSAAVIISTVAAMVMIIPVGIGLAFDGVQGVLTFLVVVVGALGLVMAAVSITNPLVTKVAHGTLRSSVSRP